MKQNPRLYGKALAEVASGKLDHAKERQIIENFVRLLKERVGRNQWPKFLAAAEEALRRKEGLRKVTIESARPLKHLEGDFKKLIKNEDVVEEKVDPALVAGVRITIDGTRQFDGSLAKKLNKLFIINK